MVRISRPPLLLAGALAVLSCSAPARALEPEYSGAGWRDALGACARSGAGALRVPQLRSKGSGRRVEGLERVLRWRLLKTALAAERLASAAGPIDCAGYADPSSREALAALLSAIDAASKRELEDFMRKNAASYDLDWEIAPVSRLSVELSTVSLSAGRFAEVCRPPAVFTEVDAPVPPDDATAEEKKAYADMAAQGEALRRGILGEVGAFQDVLKALEGSDCLETVKAFDRTVSAQRWAFLQHRDAALGALLRGRLKWRKLGD